MDKQHTIVSLNKILANYFVLYVKLYRYTWFYKGEHIFSLHEAFALLQNKMDEQIQEIAQYILAIGGKPFATMIKFVKEATIEEATADDEEEEIIQQLVSDFEILSKQMEELLTETDEATKHFLFSLLRNIKKYSFKFNAFN